MSRKRNIKDGECHFERDGVEKVRAGEEVLTEFGPVYHLPLVLKLNKDPALTLTFVVTSPNPPLLACAGVVGLLAEKPGQTQNYLTFRVLTARKQRRN